MKNKLIEALTVEYEAAYLIDLELDSFDTLKTLKGSKAMLSTNKWSEASIAFAEECSEESKAIIKMFADPAFLKNTLSKEGIQECTFQHVSSDSRWRRSYVQVIERKDDYPTKVLMTVSMIDKLVYQKEKMLQELSTKKNVDADSMLKLFYSSQNDKADQKLFNQIKILLVDDNEIVRIVSKQILENEGAIVTEAKDGLEAIELVTKSIDYDFIIMDIVMPNMDGIETTKKIVEYQKQIENKIPIIGLTSDGTDEQAKFIIDAGAYACLSKPLNAMEMSKILISYMKEKSVVLEEKMAEIKMLANTDMLTMSGNIVAYTHDIAKISEDMHEESQKIAIVMCDLDNLKGINDNYGHDIGDIYIKNCCNLIKNTFKDSKLYRVGGDEFALIVKDNDLSIIDELIKEINNQSKKLSTIEDVVEGTASVSSGYAIYDSNVDQSLSDTMRRADMAMYENKAMHKKWNDMYFKIARH